MLMNVLRAVFILALVGVAMIFLSQEDTAIGGFSLFASIQYHKDLVLLCCIGFALVVIAVDIFIPRKTLSAISGLFFGLVVGMVVAFGLSLIVDLMIKSFAPDLGTPIYGEVATESWIMEKDPATGETVPKLKTEVERSQIGMRDHPLFAAIKLGIGVICCYLAVSFILQTKDDVRFVIPYVEFAKQAKGMRPLILDTSVIIDGRITDIAETGIIESEMIVPRFVLQELQTVADSSDKLKRNRGRRGLDMLNKLQASQKTDVVILDVQLQPGEPTSVDERLVELADKTGGRLVTNDYNLNKLSQVRGVQVINTNDLASALRPVFLQGERMSIKIIKPGEEVGQGVGYLEDGTMVVVEGGREHVGKEIGIVVTNVLQTSAGRMIFGRWEAAQPEQSGRRRGGRSQA